MNNPWDEIQLNDYENHMKSDSVYQLQALSNIMKKQLYDFLVSSIMILGITGGNGLEHINTRIIKHVVGVDINKDYLDECRRRYSALEGVLDLVCVDLTDAESTLPHADLVVANLLIEYIGYECFQVVINKVRPKYVSCAIQIDTDESFVSDSPFLHLFDKLDSVHHHIEESALTSAMREIDYHLIGTSEVLLPNGKKLIRLDYGR
ncbi:MAG: class I SAM-dependent methyltransferase [Clostridia bacterium]